MNFDHIIPHTAVCKHRLCKLTTLLATLVYQLGGDNIRPNIVDRIT